jgi:hypothetical protein
MKDPNRQLVILKSRPIFLDDCPRSGKRLVAVNLVRARAPRSSSVTEGAQHD